MPTTFDLMCNGSQPTQHLNGYEQSKEHLAGIEPCNFPTLNDGLKSPSMTKSVNVPLENAVAVFAFCNQHGLSPIPVFQTVWALLLRCYVGSDWASFGYLYQVGYLGTASEIHAHEHDPSAGDYIESEMLAFSVCIKQEESVFQVIRCMEGNSTLYHMHQNGSHPFNSILVYQKRHLREQLGDAPSMVVNRKSAPHNLQGYDIVAGVEDSMEGLVMRINYSSLKLSDGAAENVAHTCGKILSSLIASFDQKIKDLIILSERDWKQILKWNRTIPERYDACIHHVIQQQACAHPDSQAVCSWDGELTYHTLDKLSSKLAHHLCLLGVGPEIVVPFAFEKSMWAVVACLATLKSGGAFLPLDPLHPLDRLQHIIEDAGANILLTSPAHAHRFEGILEKLVAISPSFLDSLEERTGDPSVEIGPQNAAIVLFTSGSTGKPKGIIQHHAAVCTMARAYGEILHINASCRVLQFAAYVFDVSTVDIFATLMHGGCVCIPSEYDRKNDIVTVVNTMQVNWANLTPSFVNHFGPDDVPTLRTLILAGEEVKQEHVVRWAGKVQLINCYGPAECGACTANSYLSPHSQAETIGHPMKCASCWIVDASHHNRLVSVGVVGELVVEGPTLARGYLNDPERTKAAFIESPEWVPASGSTSKRRFYKTGDLMFYQSDGSFSFVGRKDSQIKIRGQRVELSEAEHHLLSYSPVAKCLIAFPRSGQYAKRLVAVVQLRDFVRTAGGDDHLRVISGALLRRAGFISSEASTYMKKRLPGYMVPTAWVVIENIPLTTSKKMDRKRVETWLVALPSNHQSTSFTGPLGVDSLSPISCDKSVAFAISAKVASIINSGNLKLGVTLQGYDFALPAVGLDSIQAITLLRWTNLEFGISLGIERITHCSATIGSLAEDVERAMENPSEAGRSVVNIVSEVTDLYNELLLSSCPRRAETVFITGVTGFLGSQILRQLLIRPGIEKTIVHVRAQTVTEGLQRVIDSAKPTGWWQDSFASKIEVWPGDLAEPLLGLSEQQWKRLSGHASPQERIDAVIHNGVTVRWNVDYCTLKQANVGSTLQLLRAVSGSASSTKFVYISGGQRLSPNEEDDRVLVAQAAASTGYAQTKVVSELLIKKFASSDRCCSHQISIIKPSYIIGTAEEGVANVADYFWRLVAGAIEARAYNQDEVDSWLFISDVERVASAVLQGLDDSNVPCNTVKILDGLTLQDFWNIMTDDLGYDIQPLNGTEWWSRLRKNVEAKGEQHHLWPLLYMLEERKGNLGSPAMLTREILSTTQARVKAVIKKNVEYLRNIGFLPTANTNTIPAGQEQLMAAGSPAPNDNRTT